MVLKPPQKSLLKQPLLAAAALLLLVPATAWAHHSFAAFFDPARIVKIKGKVTDFHFTNPHGTIGLDVIGPDGAVQKWRIETNAPVVLMRRGWTRDVIKPGETISIEGWPSRDGKPYLRLRQAFDASGKLIGEAAFGQADS